MEVNLPEVQITHVSPSPTPGVSPHRSVRIHCAMISRKEERWLMEAAFASAPKLDNSNIFSLCPFG
jgi:hypothetical protein